MIVKCTKCHHEWQAVGMNLDTGPAFDPFFCDWCGAPGEKLADDYIETWLRGNPGVLSKSRIKRLQRRPRRPKRDRTTAVKKGIHWCSVTDGKWACEKREKGGKDDA